MSNDFLIGWIVGTVVEALIRLLIDTWQVFKEKENGKDTTDNRDM